MSDDSASQAAAREKKTSVHRAPDAERARPASAFDTLRTIAWSFFGVRRRDDHDRESRRINPIHVVVAGFVGVLLMVLGLILLVNWVVAK